MNLTWILEVKTTSVQIKKMTGDNAAVVLLSENYGGHGFISEV